MPETDFFVDRDDHKDFVMFVLSRGFYLVPLMRYNTPNVAHLRDFQSYRAVADEKENLVGPFLLIKEGERTSPLKIVEVNSPSGRFYSPSQRHGGPFLSFFCYEGYFNENDFWIPSSSIGYHTSYFNTETGTETKTPQFIRAAYKEIVRYIESNGKRVPAQCVGGGSREYWILSGAWESLREGARLGVGGLEHYTVDKYDKNDGEEKKE